MNSQVTSFLITGANRGIGFEFVKQLSQNSNHYIIACCRNIDKAVELKKLAQYCNNIEVVFLDLEKDESILTLANEIKTPIDVLLNVAGVSGVMNVSHDLDSVKDWMRVMKINAIGPVQMVQAFLPHLKNGNRKLVVNISSGMGSVTLVDQNYPVSFFPYNSSKAALNMGTKILAKRLLEEQITAVAIHPGWVKTDMGGPLAPLTPEESVGSICKLMDSLHLKDTGKFLNYQGLVLPW